jgi:hypothetical protein
MLKTHTEKILKDFAESVFLQAERNLPKFSGELKNSFKSVVKESANSITLSMTMADYGFYQDEGVRGVGGVRKSTSRFNKTDNKGKMWKQKGKGSRFSFKSPSINLRGGNGKGIRLWSISKGLNPYAVAKSVAMQGIKPSKFMTKALEKEFKTLPDEIVEAYGLDIDQFLAFAFKDNIKTIK